MYMEFVGLPGSGKTSLAKYIKQELQEFFGKNFYLMPDDIILLSRTRKGLKRKYLTKVLRYPKLTTLLLTHCKNKVSLLKFKKVVSHSVLHDEVKQADKFIIYDQFIIQHLSSFFMETKSQIDESLLSCVFKDLYQSYPVMAVYIEVSPMIARERLNRRILSKNHNPTEFDGLSDTVIRMKYSQLAKIYKRLLQILAKSGVYVVKINGSAEIKEMKRLAKKSIFPEIVCRIRHHEYYNDK